MPEEQYVHADDDDYQREYVKHDACLPAHRSSLLLEDRVVATYKAAEQDWRRGAHASRVHLQAGSRLDASGPMLSHGLPVS
jgi:hypothetical protein